jgi:hypothetical protein
VPGPKLRPALVPPPAPRSGPNALALWHLLSLDAPCVAALWTVFIARCARLHLPWTEPAAMFLAVWMLYAADRLLDARPQPDGSAPPELEERHRFHHRHRRIFLTLIPCAAIALAFTLHRLNPAALHLYAALGSLLAAWLLLIHAHPSSAAGSQRLPKELAVGLFFPAAVFIPTVARLPQLRFTLLPLALLFAAVCTLNCLFLYAWEHPHQRRSAHATTLWATSHLAQLSLAALVLCGLAALLHTTPLNHPACACALSISLLLALHLRRNRLAPVHLRALADAALLTPLLWLLLPLLRP